MSRIWAFLKDQSGATPIKYNIIPVGLSVRERPPSERPMSKLVLHFLSADSATTAIEYALIAGGISIFVVAAVQTVGAQLSANFYGPISAALSG
jgi:pilus assembly protein Flp/PilA